MLPKTVIHLGAVSTPHRAFEWDLAKEAANLRRHGLDFESDAAGVLAHPYHDRLCVEEFDFDHSDEDEERWITTGPHPFVPVLIVRVVWTTRQDDDGNDVTRIISARKADAGERKHYEHQLSRRP